MKLLLIGYGRHGKDVCAEILSEHAGVFFESSSMFAIREFLFDRIKEEFGYHSPEEAYENRHQPGMREWLYREISAINANDLTKLSEAIFQNNDIYVGLRNRVELMAAKDRWSDLLVIWVDATERLGITESKESCTVTKDLADVVIYNNGTLEEFKDKVKRLAAALICVRV